MNDETFESCLDRIVGANLLTGPQERSVRSIWSKFMDLGYTAPIAHFSKDELTDDGRECFKLFWKYNKHHFELDFLQDGRLEYFYIDVERKDQKPRDILYSEDPVYKDDPGLMIIAKMISESFDLMDIAKMIKESSEEVK